MLSPFFLLHFSPVEYGRGPACIKVSVHELRADYEVNELTNKLDYSMFYLLHLRQLAPMQTGRQKTSFQTENTRRTANL